MKHKSRIDQERIEKGTLLKQKCNQDECLESAHKSTAEALRQSEERYRDLVEQTECLINNVDANGCITYINAIGEKIFGKKRNELIGMSAFQFIHPDDLASTQVWFNECLSGHLPQSFIENRQINSSSGAIFHLLWTSKFIYDDKGQFKGVNSIAHDITKRKQAEEVIKESERTFRTMTEQSLIGVSVVQDGVFKYVNSKFAEIYGYTVAELLDEFPFQNLVHPDYRHKTEERLKKHLLGAAIERKNARVKVKKTGEIIYVENYGTMGYFNGAPARFNFALDVTERKRTEKELRESEERYRSLASVRDISFVVDSCCKYLYANDNCLNIYSLRGGSIVGIKYNELHDEVRSREFAESIKYVFETGNSFETEFRGRRSAKHFLQKFSPIRNSDGNVYAVTVASIDITDRKLAEEELKKHRQHLETMIMERTKELESKNIILQELNVALKVLLTKREHDKRDLEERFVMNVQDLVLPYVEQLKKGSLDARQRSHLEIIEAHLRDITKPLLINMRQFNLTPKETKVATLVRQSKSSKEIGIILGISCSSVSVHRKNIRKKMGLDNRAVNLTSRLESLLYG